MTVSCCLGCSQWQVKHYSRQALGFPLALGIHRYCTFGAVKDKAVDKKNVLVTKYLCKPCPISLFSLASNSLHSGLWCINCYGLDTPTHTTVSCCSCWLLYKHFYLLTIIPSTSEPFILFHTIYILCILFNFLTLAVLIKKKQKKKQNVLTLV